MQDTSSQPAVVRKRRPLSFFVKFFLICIVTGATIGFLLGMYGQGEKAELFFEGVFATLLVFLLGVLFLVIAIFLHTSMHEFGHFIIGKMGGFQLLSYRILFLTWNYENGDIKFSVRKNVSYDGLCAMIPPTKSPSQAFMLLFYAAGVIVNLLASVVCLAALIFNPLMNLGIRLFLCKRNQEPLALYLAKGSWFLWELNLVPLGNFAKLYLVPY